MGEQKTGEGRGAMIPDHPMKALAWLITHLNARGTNLKTGNFVTLGSVVKTVRIAESQTEAVIEFEGLGRSFARFV